MLSPSLVAGRRAPDAGYAAGRRNVNALSVKFATQLYSADAEFVWRKHGKDIAKAGELSELLGKSGGEELS